MKKLLLLSALIFSAVSAHADPQIYYKAQTSNEFDTFVGQLNVEKTKQVKGFYWAYQTFLRHGHAVYIGLQPRVKQSDNLAIFSAFGNGVTSTHANCNSGADGGHGVSCRVRYPFDIKKDYRLTITKVSSTVNGDTLWRGIVRDLATNQDTTVGEYLTPADWGQLQQSSLFFEEWFPFNGGPKDPAQRNCVPEATVKVYEPKLHKNGSEYKVNVTGTRVTAGKDKCAVKHNTPNARLTSFAGGHVAEVGFLAP